MLFSKRVVKPVYYLLFLTLLLLLVLQGFWLRYTYQLKERDFNEKVKLSLQVYNNIIQERPRLIKAMESVWADRRNTRSAMPVIRYSIDTFFTRNHVPTTYAMGLGRSKDPVFWVSDPSYRARLDTSRSRIVGLCMDKAGSLYLSFSFPGKTRYILSRLLPLIGLSAFSLLLLFFCALHLVATIRRQNRLAAMTSDFINNMTHELKTPLFTISIASRMIAEQEGAFGAGKSRNYLQSIRHETGRLKNMVDAILDNEQLGRGQAAMRMEQTDVHELLRQTTESFSTMAQEQDAELDLALRASDTVLYLDRVHMAGVVRNMLDNAFKYTRERPCVAISTRNDKNSLLISVKDNGIGIDRETRALIFERFYRAHTGNLHPVKGYGIGLSYVRSVVEAHGGTIHVDSTPGKGSEFIIHLPLDTHER